MGIGDTVLYNGKHARIISRMDELRTGIRCVIQYRETGKRTIVNVNELEEISEEKPTPTPN